MARVKSTQHVHTNIHDHSYSCYKKHLCRYMCCIIFFILILCVLTSLIYIDIPSNFADFTLQLTSLLSASSLSSSPSTSSSLRIYSNPYNHVEYTALECIEYSTFPCSFLHSWHIYPFYNHYNKHYNNYTKQYLTYFQAGLQTYNQMVMKINEKEHHSCCATVKTGIFKPSIHQHHTTFITTIDPLQTKNKNNIYVHVDNYHDILSKNSTANICNLYVYVYIYDFTYICVYQILFVLYVCIVYCYY